MRRYAYIPPLPTRFLERHDLLRRIIVAPLVGQTPVRPWAPMTDAEWDALAPLLWAMGCGMTAPQRAGRRWAGRPLDDPRGRLDAIFRAVTLKAADGARASWRALPEAHGKADTVSRSFRRWAHGGLWRRLLEELAHPRCDTVLAGMAYWICLAFRRAVRIMGLGAIVLARRLGLYSALPAHSSLLPDPDLSETCAPLLNQRICMAKFLAEWALQRARDEAEKVYDPPDPKREAKWFRFRAGEAIERIHAIALAAAPKMRILLGVSRIRRCDEPD